MAPVIRISDDLFRRLQQYGEALVDTPSTVIERILDRLEAAETNPSAETTTLPNSKFERAAETVGPAVERVPNLFLAPASGENLSATIERGVSLDSIRDALSETEAKAIQEALGDSTDLRCWAMTKKRRSVYDSMQRKDVVLFTEKGSGRFGYRGRVLGKINSQHLGERLWDVVPSGPWKLIYLLEEVRKVNISKNCLVQELGYAANYKVPGIIQVKSLNLRAALRRFGTLQQLLDSCTVDAP